MAAARMVDGMVCVMAFYSLRGDILRALNDRRIAR